MILRLIKNSTIDKVQENKEDGIFVILSTIIDVVEEGCWWYSTCVCGKTVHPEFSVYFCDMCMHHVINVIPSYRLKVVVSDETGQGIFILFDRETWLKKYVLAYLMRYFRTFCVKRICNDATIISMFELVQTKITSLEDAPVPVFGPELDMKGVKEVDIQDHSIDSDENVVLSDDIASLIQSDVEETQVILDLMLDFQ
ncbi:uncharacterized protein DS421_10g304630 [Arachis hypogaea]|nr:uncharacterized protein DS421_10g304630 [Arachis hypogaea]